MEDLKKMLGKKKEGDPLKKEANLSALKKLRSTMSDMMKDGLNGKMNKVTVAAPDKESLKEGLEKAEEIVEAAPEAEDMMPESEDMDESPDMDDSELSEEKIDEMIKELMEMKKKLQSMA